MLSKIIAVAALAVAIAVAVVIFSPPARDAGAPNVKFAEFSPDRLDIRVGETTKIVFNVQNLESREISDTRVDIMIEPPTYQPYLSIDKPTTVLPPLPGKDARTGQNEVTITATGSPAIEAVYTVRGILYAEGQQSDTREFSLRIRQ